MIKYSFKELLTLPNADKLDPQKIGESLETIATNNGGELKAADVLKAAINPRSPLHNCFEWDDTKAAVAHRLDQARAVIRSIRVEDIEASEGTAPAFISVSDKGGVSYRAVADVKKSQNLQRLILVAAERDLQAFERRYQELSDICQLVAEARARLAARRTRIDDQPTA